MRRYLITVNGKTYEVEVEEVGSFSKAQGKQGAPPVMQTAPAAEPKQAAPDLPPAPAAPTGPGTKINAPMPGKILSVKVNPGQAVKRGTVLMILEAMKMENEIQSPADGVVTAIAATEGMNVNAGALLACVG